MSASAPAALLSLVPCASALLSFLRAARAVHSGGINEGDDVRLAIINDFQRLRPRGTLMWQVEGAQTPNVESSGVVQPDGVVPFPEEAGDPATLGDQRCELSHRGGQRSLVELLLLFALVLVADGGWDVRWPMGCVLQAS